MIARTDDRPGETAPPPLAEGATTARRRTGPCVLCHRPILVGHRYALLPSAMPAHLYCIGREAASPE